MRDAPVRAGVDLAAGCLRDGMDGSGERLVATGARERCRLDAQMHAQGALLVSHACAQNYAFFLRLKY